MDKIHGEGSNAVPWSTLPAELIRRIACFLKQLEPNDVACHLRSVNKAIYAAVGSADCTTVRLSRPVAPVIYAGHWTRPDATHPLTLHQRRDLLRLTAASGVVANLEVAVRVSGLRLDQPELFLKTLGQSLLEAAAEAGQLAPCEWLRQQGLAWGKEVLAAAARGGHLELCKELVAGGCAWDGSTLGTVRAAAEGGNLQLVEWLLGQGCPWHAQAAGAAAEAGHVGLMDALMKLHQDDPDARPLSHSSLLYGAAWGCPLADFARVHAWCVERGAELVDTQDDGLAMFDAYDDEGSSVMMARVLERSVFGPTPDWADKAAWLLDERKYPCYLQALSLQESGDFRDALARPDAAQRLAWVRQRGLVCPELETYVQGMVVQGGSVEALAEVLDNGGAEAGPGDMGHAASHGHVAVLQLLHARGCPLSEHIAFRTVRSVDLFAAALRGGHVEVLDWLQRTYFPQGLPPPGTAPLVPSAFRAAANSHSVPAMRWLLQRGCPTEAEAGVSGNSWSFTFGHTSVEAVELLVEIGCLPTDPIGWLYESAGECGNYPVLAALRRLGVPWSARTFTAAVRARVPVRVLQWMVEEGCPVDLDAARAAHEGSAKGKEAARRQYEAFLQELASGRQHLEALQRVDPGAGGTAGA